MSIHPQLPESSEQRLQKPTLPYPARLLVPHRPPMLLVELLLRREPKQALVTAEAPSAGMFMDAEDHLLPEYYIELVAQAMAAVNGYDARLEGHASTTGYLVGVEEFTLQAEAVPGETLHIELEKTFAFGAVTIMKGQIQGQRGVLAQGMVKVWEEKGEKIL